MRPSQNKRMRGRNNNRRGPNPLTRSYESNGPDVKIRGNAQHVAEKYLQLARDAHTSGDPVGAENYLQHAEHYFRLIASAQAAQQQMQQGFARPQGEGEAEDVDDDDDVGGLSDRFASPAERASFQGQPNFSNGPQPPQPPQHSQSYQDRPPYDNNDRQPQGDRPYQGGRPNNRQDNRQDNRMDQRDNRGPRPDRSYPDQRDNRGNRGSFRSYRDQQPMRGEAPQPNGPPAAALPSFISAPPRATPTPEGEETSPGAIAGERQETLRQEPSRQESSPMETNESEPRFRGRRRRRPNFNFDNSGEGQREEAQEQPDPSEAPAGE